jgi:hypothetical protein
LTDFMCFRFGQTIYLGLATREGFL